MTKFFKIFTPIVFILALGLGFFMAKFYLKPQGPTPSPINQKQFKVGLVAELSGQFQNIGKSSQQGAEIAINEINAGGGIKIDNTKYLLVLETKDNKSTVEDTRKAVSDFAQENVSVMIGPNVSLFAVAAADIAEQKKILMISPWSTDPQTTLNSSNEPKKYVFRAAFLDENQSKALAKFAKNNLKARTASIIYDSTNATLTNQADAFKKDFQNAGGKIIKEIPFTPGLSSYQKELLGITSSRPDIIYLPAYPTEAATIIKQAKSMKITQPFLGSDAWAGTQILNLCASSCDGVYFSGHFSAAGTSKPNQKFVALYQKKYHTDPDDVAALTYDSVKIASQDIDDTNTFDSDSLVSGLNNFFKYEGATGEIDFTPQSNDPIKSVVFQKIEKAKIVWQTNIQP